MSRFTQTLGIHYFFLNVKEIKSNTNVQNIFMNKIVLKKQFSDKVFLFEIEAPLIAKSRKAGNFVIVRVGNNGERIPLTIADADKERGTITIVVQKVGLSSSKQYFR